MATMPPVYARDYPDFTFDVVSSELPCGAAWLANCFLELNIPVWQPWGIQIKNEWQRLAPFHYQYKATKQPWKQTLPALQYLREYHFEAAHAACFHHQWPLEYEKTRRLIFFVRDPRDALYSHWRRAIHNDPAFNLSFEAFVHSPYHHYPITFREYQLLFLKLWKNHLHKSDHLIVRFEDYKMNARQTLCKVLEFLNFEAAEDQLSQSIAGSDFSVVKQIEDQLENSGLLVRKFNYAGTAFEYQKSYTPMMHDCIGSDFDEIYQWLGYTSHDEARKQSKPLQVSDKRMHALISAIDPGGDQKGVSQQRQEVFLQQLNSCRHYIQSSTK